MSIDRRGDKASGLLLQMRTRPAAALWMICAFLAALALAAAVLLLRGTGAEGVRAALRATARLNFLLFWPAYAGSALASLFGGRFEPVRRRGRELGLAFAAALLVHLGLVGWLSAIGDAPAVATFAFFGIGAIFVYLIALLSVPALHGALRGNGWRLLRLIGMNYVALAFAVDFLQQPLGGSVGHVLAYLPFAALAVAGPGLRVAAYARRLVSAGLIAQRRRTWPG